MRKIILICFLMAFALGDGLFIASTGLEYDEEKAQLGKRVFFDKRISPNGTFSCESCHNLYWDFSGTVRIHISNKATNPPAIINTAGNYLFGINGNVRSLKDQIRIALLSNEQMGATEDKILSVLNKAGGYRSEFFKVYQNGVSIDNIVDVLYHFIRSIYTVNSPFDKFLLGDENAITPDEKEGFVIFNKVGCVSCHTGVNLGTNLKHMVNFYEYMLSDKEPEKNSEIFRIPSLRNIARTAPYMHDGSVNLLRDVIKTVGKIQLFKELSDDEVDKIYKFLQTLNGERPRILK